MKIIITLMLAFSMNCLGQFNIDTMINNQKVYLKPDVMPVFENKFICNTILYPKYASENDISGKVKVGFIVRESGLVSNIEIKNSSDTTFSKQVLKCIKNSKISKPAMVKNVPVNVYIEYVFNFSMK